MNNGGLFTRQPSGEGAALGLPERGAGGRHRAGLDDLADELVLGAPGAEGRPIDARAAQGPVALRADALEDRSRLRVAPRIVSGVPDRQPDQAGRRGEHEIAAVEPEQVICSCRVHGGANERAAAVDENHPAEHVRR